jgi:hypothetical protein
MNDYIKYKIDDLTIAYMYQDILISFPNKKDYKTIHEYGHFHKSLFRIHTMERNPDHEHYQCDEYYKYNEMNTLSCAGFIERLPACKQIKNTAAGTDESTGEWIHSGCEFSELQTNFKCTSMCPTKYFNNFCYETKQNNCYYKQQQTKFDVHENDRKSENQNENQNQRESESEHQMETETKQCYEQNERYEVEQVEWYPDITCEPVIINCIQTFNGTYCAAAVTYSDVHVGIHLWDAHTQILVHAFLCNYDDLSCEHRLFGIHWFKQSSTQNQYFIICTEYRKHSYLYRYKMNDGFGILEQKFEFDPSSEHFNIVQTSFEGQVGIFLFQDLSILCMNLLTLKVLNQIKSTASRIPTLISINKYEQFYANQYNHHLVYLLSCHDLYHLLPADSAQFDCHPMKCAPIINSFKLPCALIVCGVGHELYIYHAYENESQLMNRIEFPTKTMITCIDLFKGD